MLSVGEERSFAVTLVDLTRDGCRIATNAVLSPRLRIGLAVPGLGTVAGRIIWAGPAGYGCEFDRSLASGAVTAAHMSASRAARGSTATLQPRLPTKMDPRMRVLLLLSAATASWSAIVGSALLLLG